MSRLWAACVCAALGCGSTQALDQQIRVLRSIADQARERGAYRCAPEELALSEAHLEFAEHELGDGDLARARQHLVLARANASAAARLSEPASCVGSSPSPLRGTRAPAHSSETSAQRALRRGSTRDNAAI